jgi:hypothetical protein
MNRSTLPFFLLTLAALTATGCSDHPKTYPVSGTVTFDDGTPVTGGTVEFRNVTMDVSKQVNARGEIGPDGKYQLTTYTPNDGAVAGDHQIAVFPLAQETPGNLSSEPPPNPIERKYQSYDTSGLTYTVKTDGPNVMDIKVGKKVAGSK